MDILIFTAITLIALGVARRQYERKRIALLASYLGRFQIEKMMATLSDA